MKPRRAWLLFMTLLAMAASVVAADELVTRDGQVIQTRGPWEMQGKLLVFELPDGTLASLRADEADLEATERRAREKARRAQQARQQAIRPEPEPQAPVMVLTDKDVSHALDLGEEPEPEGLATAAEEAGGQATATAAPEDTPEDAAGDDQEQAAGGEVDASGRGVQVVQWSQESEGDDGVAVRGVIQNLGTSFATSLSVNALFYDEAGGLVAAREVQFEEGPLGPGSRRDFSVSLPHSLIYDEIRFQVLGRGFRSVGQSVRSGPPPEAPDEFEIP